MKTSVLFAALGVALISFPGMGSASDDFAGGCKRKEQAIETKMEYARKHGNQEQLVDWKKRSAKSADGVRMAACAPRQNSRFWKSKIKCRSGRRISIRLSQKAREKRKEPSCSAS